MRRSLQPTARPPSDDAARRGGAGSPYPTREKVIPMSSPTWRKRAACRGLDPEVFYPPSDEEAEEAKAICGECPVRQLCLEHALAHRERDGVWGGLTERERRRLVRQRRKSA